MSETTQTYQVATQPQDEPGTLQKSEYKSIEQFQVFLNKAPDKREIKKNPYEHEDDFVDLEPKKQPKKDLGDFSDLRDLDDFTSHEPAKKETNASKTLESGLIEESV